MKKSKFLRCAVILLVIAMATGALFAGNTTLAKYTATASGTGTAEVAKWDVKLGSTYIGDITVSPMVIWDTADPGKTDTDVASGKIAPGTYGTIAGGTITNDSDVRAKVTVTATLTGTNWPTGTDQTFPDVIILTKGSTPTTFTSGTAVTLIDGVEMDISDTLALDSMTWTWEFGSTGKDGRDTAIGRAAVTTAPTLKVEYTITADQID